MGLKENYQKLLWQCFVLFLKKFFVGIELIYNVVLLSNVQ